MTEVLPPIIRMIEDPHLITQMIGPLIMMIEVLITVAVLTDTETVEVQWTE